MNTFVHDDKMLELLQTLFFRTTERSWLDKLILAKEFANTR